MGSRTVVRSRIARSASRLRLALLKGARWGAALAVMGAAAFAPAAHGAAGQASLVNPAANQKARPPAALFLLLRDTARRPEAFAAIRREAARNAGFRGEASARATAILTDNAADASLQVYACRIVAVCGQGKGDAIAALVSLAGESKSVSVRAAAMAALGRLGVASEPAVRALRACAGDGNEDPYLRAEATRALGRIGPAESSRKALVDLLGGEDETVALEAARALARRGATGAPILARRLRSPQPRVRRFAAYALAKIGPPAAAAFEELARATRDSEPSVRRNALEALGCVAGRKAVDLLRRGLKDPSAGVALAAAEALAKIAADDRERDAWLASYRKRTAWRPRASEDPAPYRNVEWSRYEIGGPLAGRKLPLFKARFGARDGWPGEIEKPSGVPWPLLQLYPKSVEHYRAYMIKYLPVRSFFDEQSLLRNWIAPAIPADRPCATELYAAPIYWCGRFQWAPTGKTAEPVPVIRCKVRAPVFRLDLGDLDIGLYAVRVIAAVETKDLRPFRKPLFLAMTINDGPDGAERTYRLRCNYVDEFYSVAEFYVHVVEKRRFAARLFVDRGSAVDLLVHNITLDNVLAGTIRRAIKTRAACAVVPKRDFAKSRLAEDRLARDAAIWKGMPHLNAQTAVMGPYGWWASRIHFQSKVDMVRLGMDGRSLGEIRRTFGRWRAVPATDPNARTVLLRNEKLGLVYTVRQFNRGEPLPDPYPWKDDGAGLYRPDPNDPKKGEAFTPVADGVWNRERWYFTFYRRDAIDRWLRNGDVDAAWDAAMTLIRMAYRAPAMDCANRLEAAASTPAQYGRDVRCRQRVTNAFWLDHYMNTHLPALAYDKLFSFIDGNEPLAQSVHRFVPWVHTSRDVVKLLDVYLVQTFAKRIMRYQYYTGPMKLAYLSLALTDRPVVKPWLDWVFTRTFVYPLRPAGAQDLMIDATDRNGTRYIGSTFYAGGEGAMETASVIDPLVRAGLLEEKYDLTNPDKYPRPLAHAQWQIDRIVAGCDFLRIGDVAGAERPGSVAFLEIAGRARLGWRWSRDPRFAWIMARMGKRSPETSDAEWARIEKAAATVRRPPWFENRSRAIFNWAGVLETGLRHDDPRFRRCVYVRAGLGYGHAHYDALDLQIVAHGLPMTVDGGQRPGYSIPGDSFQRVHNTVEVDRKGARMFAWVRALADAEGARYMQVQAVAPSPVRLYRREVALIDVDEGRGEQPLTAEQMLPGAKLPPVTATANSYVVDVFRVSGGSVHTYCFHGPVSDDVKTDARDMRAVPQPKTGQAATPDQEYLKPFSYFPESWRVGRAGDRLEAVWRYARTGPGGEASLIVGGFDPKSPRKFLRLRLLGVKGDAVYRAAGWCRKLKYRLDHLFVQRSLSPKDRAAGNSLDSVFAAVIEPYVGRPFLDEVRRESVSPNEKDARCAVAISVRTRNGHRDLSFFDGRPGSDRRVAGLRICAQYAFYSVDDLGLREMAITGGERIETPAVQLHAAASERRARIIEVDYARREVTIDAAWPSGCAGELVEIERPGERTSFTLDAVQPLGGRSRLTFVRGALYFQSRVRETRPAQKVVVCDLAPYLGDQPGLSSGLTATNARRSKFWRTDFRRNEWRLRGPAVSRADFEPDGRLYVYEYGVGDLVRAPTRAVLRRVRKDVFRVTGDVNLSLRFKAARLDISMDGKVWKPGGGRRENGWTRIDLKASDLSGKGVWVRLARKPSKRTP